MRIFITESVYISILALILAGVFLPLAVFAQPSDTGLVQCGEFFEGGKLNFSRGCTWCDLLRLVRDIINFAVEILFVIATLMIVYGGVRYLISFGSTSELGKAKEILTAAIWGLIFGLLSYFIIGTVIQVIAGFTTPEQTAQYPKGLNVGFPWPWNQIDCKVVPGAPITGGREPPVTPPEVPEQRMAILADGQQGSISIESGKAVSLTWSTAGFDECSVTPGICDQCRLSDTATTPPLTETTTYTLTCSSPTGSGEAQVIVNVGPVEPSPPPELNITVNGSTSPPPVVAGTSAATVQVSWTSSYTKFCIVAISGSTTTWTGTDNDNIITLDQTTTFTLNCEGLDGSKPTKSVTQVVNPPPESALCAACRDGDGAKCEEMAGIHKMPYPRRNDSDVNDLIGCVRTVAKATKGKDLGSVFSYDVDFPYCNYNRNDQDHSCGSCSHKRYSCHYAGGIGPESPEGGAQAVDFGLSGTTLTAYDFLDPLEGILAKCPDTVKSGGAFDEGNHIHVSTPGCDKDGGG